MILSTIAIFSLNTRTILARSPIFMVFEFNSWQHTPLPDKKADGLLWCPVLAWQLLKMEFPRKFKQTQSAVKVMPTVFLLGQEVDTVGLLSGTIVNTEGTMKLRAHQNRQRPSSRQPSKRRSPAKF